MWQELRAELHGDGLEVVTVALDSAGPEAARPWIEAARPEHPALIDEQHRLDELFGIVNVPSGVWIDEAGVIVRPPEPAFAAYPEWEEGLGEDASEYQRRTLENLRSGPAERKKLRLCGLIPTFNAPAGIKTIGVPQASTSVLAFGL